MTFSTLAERTLPAVSQLQSTSCCPTRDLLAVTSSSSNSAPTSSNQSTLTLWRTTGQADSVWEWRVGGTVDVKGKGKAVDSTLLHGGIQYVAYHPQGGHIAVSTTKSTITLLSVDTGTAVLPPLEITSASGPVPLSHLAWIPLQLSTSKIASNAASLLALLPILPPLEKEVKSSAAVTASGVFGSAKNAMLLRERAKEAGRVLDINLAAPRFPALIAGPGEEELEHSILVVGDKCGTVHLYLGGSVHIGSITLQGTTTIAQVTLLPSTDTTCRIALLLSDTKLASSLTTISLALPSTTLLVAQQATLLREMLGHAFGALQEARVLWDEARRIAVAWLARLAELGQPHGVTQSPTLQLLHLLLTGRSNVALADFLASKMNERGFTKFQVAMTAAYTKLKACSFMSLAPALERSIVLLDEAKAWAIWPEQFGQLKLDLIQLRQCTIIASEIIAKTSAMEQLVVDEELCFTALVGWFRYELEKVAQQEGSEVRPAARFYPQPVAHYLQHCMAESVITPYLAFGLAATPLSSMSQLGEAEVWCAQEEAAHTREEQGLNDETEESVLLLIARLARDLAADGEGQVERISRGVGAPASIPVLLHVLAGKVGNVFATSLQQLSRDQRIQDSTQLARLGEDKVKSRHIGTDREARLYYAAVAEKSLQMTRTNLDSIPIKTESTHLTLLAEDGTPIDVIDFDFFDDSELILAIKLSSAGAISYALSTVELSSIDFAVKTQEIKFARSHALSTQFPPAQIALNGRPSRRVACVLAGSEGRRLEVFDLDNGDEEEESDVDMGEEGGNGDMRE